MYQIIDTFNDTVVSRHRSLEAAVKADDKFRRDVRRANGATSYIPTRILDHDGDPILDGHPEWERSLEIANGLRYWQ
jgi:hypothetical protein